MTSWHYPPREDVAWSIGVKCVVPLSGGKDSQACLKLAVQTFGAEHVLALFCDTQFEHWKTYAHVAYLVLQYRVRVVWLTEGSVLERSEHFGRFPGGGSRHCTDYLKIRPTKRFLKALAQQQGSRAGRKRRGKRAAIEPSTAGGFEVWFGMRSDESTDRTERYAGKVADELYAPHEVLPSKYPKYLAALGVSFRLAVLDWSTLDVLEFLEGDQNPLYPDFDRVGCFPCLAANDTMKERAFAYDPFGAWQKQQVAATSQRIGKSVWTSKSGEARNAPTMLCGLHCGT